MLKSRILKQNIHGGGAGGKNNGKLIERACGDCSGNIPTGRKADWPKKQTDQSAGSKNGINGSVKPIPATRRR